MGKRSAAFKFLILAGLLTAAGLVLFISGVGLSATVVTIGTLSLILWLFTGKRRPDNEQPCSAVSCCHYLEDYKDVRPPATSHEPRG